MPAEDFPSWNQGVCKSGCVLGCCYYSCCGTELCLACAGGGICRGTDTWGLLPVGGSVWFTLSWLMVMVFAVVIVDIRELAG